MNKRLLGGFTMSITLQQIDLLRERANVSYEAAKDALEKTNGNIVEALVYLEKEGKTKKAKHSDCKFWEKTKILISKGNETRFIIKNKENSDIVNLSVNVSILIGIIATPVVVIGLPAALLTKHKIRVARPDGEDLKVNKIFDKVSDTVNSVADNLTEKKEENL